MTAKEYIELLGIDRGLREYLREYFGVKGFTAMAFISEMCRGAIQEVAEGRPDSIFLVGGFQVYGPAALVVDTYRLWDFAEAERSLKNGICADLYTKVA